MNQNEVMVLRNKQTGKLESINIHTGELIATEGGELSTFVYTLEMSSAICALVREGQTYKQIALMEDLPNLHQIYAWRNKFPEFDRDLKQARKDRADYHFDMASQELEDGANLDKDEVAAAKFRFDGHLKLAEKGNQDDYGKKTHITGNTGGGATLIVINTGINRTEEKEDAEENTEQRRDIPTISTTSREVTREGFGSEIDGLNGLTGDSKQESGSEHSST